jgi:hypothetical protein
MSAFWASVTQIAWISGTPSKVPLLADRTVRGEEERVNAALVTLTIDPEQAPAAAAVLTSDVLPTLQTAPGFIAGYWLDPEDGRGFAMILFETEEQARQAVPPVNDWSAPGVTIDNVDFRRVAATLP